MNLRRNSHTRAAGGSFRDPDGFLLWYAGRAIRIVNKDAAGDLKYFLASRVAREFSLSGELATTRVLESSEAIEILKGVDAINAPRNPALVLEHGTIPFQSFPYEWPFEMLRAAALLTLDLAEAALKEGLGLKDATPYNVLFRGPQAVFVDILSFERRNAKDPIWLACAQFERTFLIPLLASAELDAPLDMLLSTRRDGLYPCDAIGFFGPAGKLKPAVLSSITIPVLLERRKHSHDPEDNAKRLVDSGEKAAFILGALFRRLRRAVTRIPPLKGMASRWSDYMRNKESYSEDQFLQKQQFVEEALDEYKPQKVLDIGCNTGHFSTVAAQKGASVVAIDSDTRVVGKLWDRAVSGKLDILPLVVSIAQPSPSMGWRNRETASFLERAHGNFDAVLMLAVIHHILVTDRIPLDEILDLVAELTTGIAIVEFVSPNDPQFRAIASVNQSLYQGVTHDAFERACLRRFTVVRSRQLSSSNRWMYLLRKDCGVRPAETSHCEFSQ